MCHQTPKLDGTIEADASGGEAEGLIPIQDGIRIPFGSVHAGAMIRFAGLMATTLALEGKQSTLGGEEMTTGDKATLQHPVEKQRKSALCKTIGFKVWSKRFNRVHDSLVRRR
ncbi:hypothetical protein [uncultured Roseibium sp.]|uniref:hypothetical protein n=1 Tax=uncultured Roseibium sp. TaxID=1936171 RepID=UPI00262EFFE4|nr:hypothetical protein [uncultured Roseibium sp.]